MCSGVMPIGQSWANAMGLRGLAGPKPDPNFFLYILIFQVLGVQVLGVSHLLYSTDYSWFFVNLLNRHYLSTYLYNMLRHWSCEKQIGARRCRCCSAVREKLVDVPVPVWVTDASDPWSIWCDSERELSPIDMAWRRRWMKLNILSSWSKLDQCKR